MWSYYILILLKIFQPSTTTLTHVVTFLSRPHISLSHVFPFNRENLWRTINLFCVAKLKFLSEDIIHHRMDRLVELTLGAITFPSTFLQLYTSIDCSPTYESCLLGKDIIGRHLSRLLLYHIQRNFKDARFSSVHGGCWFDKRVQCLTCTGRG